MVTGGAGYIGSHACKALKKKGYVPVALDNLSTGWRDAVKFGPLEVADLLDHRAIMKIFKKYRPTAVMHFGGLSQVGESVCEPEKYWRNNFVGSLNLIQATIANNCNNFVFSSTCATYGQHDQTNLTENTSQKPTNPYGASKRAVEEALAHFSNVSSLNFAIFRYFNVAGADPESQIGECHHPETHLIPLVLDVISGERKAITIYGTDYNTPDGTCIRDYVHVSDLVDAHILGLNRLENSKDNCIYNLGTGHGFSVRDIIQSVNIITNQNVNVIEGPRRAGDVARLVSGSELAMKELGWKPSRSILNQMITDAWRWKEQGAYNS